MTDSLVSILEQEIELVSRFQELLKREQICLVEADVDGLPEITEDKRSLSEQLNALGKARMAAIGQDGNASDRAVMEAWIEKPGNASKVGLWRKLQELAREAKNLHELNGRLLESHLKRTSEALSILTRHASQSSLYAPSGKTVAITGSHIVDSA